MRKVKKKSALFWDNHDYEYEAIVTTGLFK